MASSNPVSVKYPFESHYIEIERPLTHYVQDGKDDPILYVPENPGAIMNETWSSGAPRI